MYRELAKEYKKTLRDIRKAKQNTKIQHDKEILTNMETSTKWTLQYLQLEHEPGLQRGIHRRSREQREVLLGDIEYISSEHTLYPPKAKPILPEQTKKLDAAMAVLSEREREVFELVEGQGFSQYETAELLKISRSTVQSYLQNAREKLQTRPFATYK